MSRQQHPHESTETPSPEAGFSGPVPLSLSGYQRYYQSSVQEREAYWQSQAGKLEWLQPFTSVLEENLGEAYAAWFKDGRLNAAHNALQVQLQAGRGDAPALIHFAEDGRRRTLSYAQLAAQVSRLAAAFAARDLYAGDRVALFLPDQPEAIIGALACARLGLISVPISDGFPWEVVRRILENCEPGLVVVAGQGKAGYLTVAGQLAAELGPEKVVVVGGGGPAGTLAWDELLEQAAALPEAPLYDADAEHPLFLLYPGTGAGIPRGSVFATGGYLVQARTSFTDIFTSPLPGEETPAAPRPLFTVHPLASAAGQTYGLWGPLLAGGCIVRAELGEAVGRPQLEQLLEACPGLMMLATPKLLTRLRREMGNVGLSSGRRFSLVASCGDMLAPRLVQFAAGRLVDTAEQVLNLWLQSAGGAALICSHPRTELNRIGAIGLSAPAVEPRVLNEHGAPCRPNEGGQLVFASSWPAMVRNLWNQQDRYRELYFNRIPGHFSTNDAARVDREGFYWLMGRLDDLIKVNGHSLYTSEVESVLAAHPRIAEAAVVGVSGEEGGGLVAFLVSHRAAEGEVEPDLEGQLAEHLRRRLGEFALPSRYLFVRELPRTRSGKVVRRVLRRFATGDASQDEDWSNVANPGSLDDLLRRS